MRISLAVDNMDEGDSDSGVPLWSLRKLEHTVGDFLRTVWPESSHYIVIEISVSLLSTGEIRCYNNKYRGVDQPTDVLSFPMWEVDGIFTPPADMNPLPLGDILICPSLVKLNSSGSGRDTRLEMCLMLAHGILHLLGMDHDTPERKRKMWEMQALLSERIESCLQKGENSPAGEYSDV